MPVIQPARVAALGDLEIEVARTFNAPRALVARAFTEPALLQRWLGVFGDWSWASCEIDVRPGGSYRWEWRQPNGAVLVLSGDYREVTPEVRYVMTQRYEGLPEFPNEMLVTMTLEEEAGRTTVVQVSRYATREERDRDLQYMPNGIEPSYATLDGVLAAAA
ncbi:MAG: ATPase [Chloroflexota bacterium]